MRIKYAFNPEGWGTLGSRSRSTPQPMWDIKLEFDKGRQQTENSDTTSTFE